MSETTASLSKHCCLIMDKMIDEQYLFESFTFGDHSIEHKYPPHIEGPKLTEHGRKRRPSMIVNFCPWCGKRLAKAEALEPVVEVTE